MTEINPTTDHTSAPLRFSHIMPLAFITYGLAYLDRVNYGSGEKGLSKSLHLSPAMGPWVSAAFFLGYALFQIPGAIYAAKRSVKPLVFAALLLWGLFSALTGIITNLPLLIFDRILLGAVEGVVLPVMLIYLTRWFTKAERSRSNSLLMLTNPVVAATASALCGVLIQYFDAHPLQGYQGWQMMFIIEGLPSILWAFLWLWLARENPAHVTWLTSAQVNTLQQKIDAEQATIPAVRNYRAAFSDPRVIKLSFMFLCFSATAYGLLLWLPGIIAEGTKQSPAIAGFLTSVPYLVAIPAMLTVSWISDRIQKRKRFVVGSMFLGCCAFILSRLAGPDHFWIAYIGLVIAGTCLYMPTAPLFAWMAEMLPRNVAGESMALVNSVGALGGFIGTIGVGWLKNYFGTTDAAFLFQASSFALAGLLGLWVTNPSPITNPLSDPRIPSESHIPSETRP